MTLTRSAIIAEAITLAKRKGQAISLTTAFDEVTLELSEKWPILRDAYAIGLTTDGQSYVILPDDYRVATPEDELFNWKESMYLLDGSVKSRIYPEDYSKYLHLLRTLEQIEEKPVWYSVNKAHNKIYLRSTPDKSTYVWYFYYCRVHPAAGRKLAFTSGGTHEVLIGDTITGETGGATGIISAIILTSGSWKDGDAAGDFIISTQTGTFQAETVKEGSNLNVATIAADSSTADNFTHYFGREFDIPICYRLGAKCCFDYISDPEQGKILLASYEEIITQRFVNRTWRKGGMQSNFWNPSWGRR